MIREAREQDADAIARIYNQAMKPGIYATAEVQPATADSRRAWLRSIEPPYGAWVYEAEDGNILGYCALGPFPVRPYKELAEVTIYVDEHHQGKRIGALLIACMIRSGRQAGFRSLAAIVFEKNIPSIAGCMLAGFEPMAILASVATFGSEYLNVSWIQKDLSVPDPPVLQQVMRRLSEVMQ